MRTLLLLSLCSLRLAAAVAVDNFKDGGYSGSGVHSTTILASGTNLGCIVVTWYRGGSTTTPTCGGNSMTKISTMSTSLCAASATIDTWVYFGSGLSAGTLTASLSATVESILEVITVNGAAQSGQPDALAAYTGVLTNSGGGVQVPITTVANNSLVIATGCGTSNHATTGNGTFFGQDANVGMTFYKSTSDVTPAGSFTLQAMGNAPGTGEANGLSISPPSATGSTYTSSTSIIVVGP